jgi:hypothetical protein
VIKEKTGHKDDDGIEICVGDELRSSYGIPPKRISGKVYKKRDGSFWVATPAHLPRRCTLKGFIKHFRQLWVDNAHKED